MKGGIEQPDDYRVSAHDLEYLGEIIGLKLANLRQGREKLRDTGGQLLSVRRVLYQVRMFPAPLLSNFGVQ